MLCPTAHVRLPPAVPRQRSRRDRACPDGHTQQQLGWRLDMRSSRPLARPVNAHVLRLALHWLSTHGDYVKLTERRSGAETVWNQVERVRFQEES